MKLEVGEWYAIGGALGNLLNKDLPVKTSFKLSRLAKNLAPILQTVEEKRNEMVKRYGQTSESGDTITVTKENEDKFKSEWKELTSIQEEVDFEPIDPDDLGDLKMPPQQLMILDKLFK